MDNIQSRLRLYSLLETYLRQAGRDVKPVTARQLFSTPDIHRAAGSLKEVVNIIRQLNEKGVLVNFSPEKTSVPESAWTWKDDAVAPKIRFQNRRTLEERRAAAATKPKFVGGVNTEQPPTKEQVDLFAAMGTAHVLNKPKGQEAGYAPTPGSGASIMVLALTAVKDGHHVDMSTNTAGKIILTITER